MRDLELTREEAESLVDLLEEKPRVYPLEGLADVVRELFGMGTRERQKEVEAK